MSDLLDTLRSFAQNGISWATVISVLLFLSKQREGHIRSRERAEMRQDIKAIKATLGVEEWSNGQASGSNSMDLRSLKKLSMSLLKVIHRGNPYQRRKKRMNTSNINWYTFIPALVAALKLIFQTLNIPFIADAQANELANGAAALLTIIGVALSHRKDGAANVPVKAGDSGPAI